MKAVLCLSGSYFCLGHDTGADAQARLRLAELTEKLHDKDIEIRVPTLPGISTHGTAEGNKTF